jgi:two-component system sensor histidine kinase PilS (NtrC family)
VTTALRYTPASPAVSIQSMINPRRMVRWVWVGRAALACAILVAAVFVWDRADRVDTLLATLAFACAMLATVASAMYADVYQRPVGRWFYAMQCAVDLLLVTAVVHITGGWSSQFAALYILVIALAALMLPFRDGLWVAAGACLLYSIDVLWLRTGTEHFGVAVQLAVFVIVAVGSGFIAVRLRQAGAGRDALAAQLAKVQLEAADILRTIKSGIISVDANGRLLYANPAAADLLDLPLRSLVGRPVLEALSGVAPQLALLLERTAKEGVRTTRAEGSIRRGGKDIPIGVTTTIADVAEGSSTMTATAIFQDISDTKRLQALHVRAERLEAIAELSASLAHEIKNPLASIRSATEQLALRHAASRPRLVTGREDLEDEDDERVLHTLVVREADRLSRLLTEFLDFARARVTKIEALDAGDLVRKAVLLAGAHPDKRNDVRVTIAAPPQAISLQGDEDLMHRAVFNLVLNAVQAVSFQSLAQDGGGHVHIETSRAAETEGTPRPSGVRWSGETLLIAVSDNGPGVPEELRNTMFEPFVTTKQGGSGLGLSVVHRAVEAHGGVVMAEALNPGTRFTILLPLDAERAVLGDVVSNFETDSASDNAMHIDSRITGAAA